MSVGAGHILGMGNPLLDISATVKPELLEKYGLKSNDAILAQDMHKPIYEEIVKDYEVEYIAGGATQNSIRVAQWMLGKEPATAYIGSVGKDEYADTLAKKASEGGTTVEYFKADVPTGTCAVLITGEDRSLVANISAAEKYDPKHLDEVAWKHVENAKIVYISGFFLTVSPPSINKVGKYCSENDTTFMMNLAAEFICQFFKDPLVEALKYCDIVFGNETEFAKFSEVMEFGTTDLHEIVKKTAALEKVSKKPRTVICTQGPLATIIFAEGESKEYPIITLTKEEIVDTNGAGDAWVGGFLAGLAKGKNIEECAKAAAYSAKTIIMRSGCTYPEESEFKF